MSVVDLPELGVLLLDVAVDVDDRKELDTVAVR